MQMSSTREMSRRKATTLQAIGGCAFLLSALTVNAQVTYKVTDLGVLPGGSTSTATAINENGVVVGHGDTPENWQRPFRWEDGVMVELPLGAGATRAWPNDINDAGRIVGSVMDDRSQQMATMWEDGIRTELGTLGGIQSAADSVAESGKVVGWGMYHPDITIRRWRPFVYEDGVMTDLGSLPGGVWNSARAISKNGQQIAGDGQISRRTPDLVGVIQYDPVNGAVPMGTLGGMQTYTTAIDDDGWIIGSSRIGTATDNGLFFVEHAFLCAADRMIDLGVIFGNNSRANGLNGGGVIVGTCWDSEETPWEKRGFVRFDEALVDLTTLLPNGNEWIVLEAMDINDAGQIVGRGRLGDVEHAILLTPQ